MSSDIEETSARVSERGQATRGALLRAAREVFAQEGFAQAAVTDIVAKAGASVGSLYHHFNGKADLYLTLFEEFQARQQDRTREAIYKVRDEGERDPQKLFLAGAAAYLRGSVEERELSRLFISGDGPPGFDRIMRDRLRKWARRNAALFQGESESFNEPLVIVLTGAMLGAVSEVSLGDDRERADRLSASIIRILGTIKADQ
ncbi:TetR/AcrR family transcriptional regulator [Actinocorallia sp. API 0066]|uniref:TetR/AcrR family transcriptional regulator n=1 Tax=Actinocorallia sp. API 0066 TaxID=2896846 RepID=UPI001E355419|nr:TetR/AcrR family transcriptional regulator [Actinocorallia sp. API 0066]MCD0447898.1 TetR/AcrR family transcriptional regulator [Actinocorallia sp. API 0066]